VTIESGTRFSSNVNCSRNQSDAHFTAVISSLVTKQNLNYICNPSAFLTNSMDQSPSSEADSRRVDEKEFPAFNGTK
jgi:hypothetical protein